MAKLAQTTTRETKVSWSGLANLIKGGEGTLKIGDVITEQTIDGEELDLVVVDIGDEWARFESRDCLPAEVAYHNERFCDGGFASSDVMKHLNETVFNSLPEELRSVIAEVERTQEDGTTYRARLFLPTESEVFGDSIYSKSSDYPQLEYYKDRRHRVKCDQKGGLPCWYWLSSTAAGSSAYCVYVTGIGNAHNWTHAGNGLHVPVCFIIK